jgi:hypothetical protein
MADDIAAPNRDKREGQHVRRPQGVDDLCLRLVAVRHLFKSRVCKGTDRRCVLRTRLTKDEEVSDAPP